MHRVSPVPDVCCTSENLMVFRGDSRSTSASLRAGSRSTSENGTQRSSRLHFTVGSSGGSHATWPSEGVVQRCCDGARCRRPCVGACRDGKLHHAGPDSQACFNSSDSLAAFVNQSLADVGRYGSMPTSIFYELTGRLPTAPERLRYVSLITICRGSFAVGRCVGKRYRPKTYGVMPHRGVAPSVPRASTTLSRF